MRQAANVLIVDGDVSVRTDLRRLVTSLGHVVVGEAGSGSQALTLTRSLRPAVVLLDLAPPLAALEAARSIAAERLAAVVLMMNAGEGEPDEAGPSEDAALDGLDDSGAMAFLIKPLRPGDLRALIPIAVARHRERVALEDEVRSLNERMEARKLVGRAKAILMERQGLSEREAFRRIQSQSVTLNRPVHEIARAIITASEISVEGRAAVRGGAAPSGATVAAVPSRPAEKGAVYDQD